MDETTSLLKDKIEIHEFAVYNETSIDGENEIIFTLIPADFFPDRASQEIIERYNTENSLHDLSQVSQDYIKAQTKFYPVLLAKINKNSLFETKDIDFIKANTNNFVSKKLVGEAVNASNDFEAMFDKYSYRAGALIMSAAEVASDALQRGIEKVSSTDPKELLNQGAAKLGGLIAGFRSKLKDKIAETPSNKPKL